MSSIGKHVSRAAISLVVMLALAGVARAQVFTGTVSGTIKDAQGGVIPGVTIVLLNESQGTRTAPAVTNENGDFVFPNVAAGTYTVEASLTGFKSLKRAGVVVSGGDRVAVGTLELEVGGTQETVDVKAEAPLLQMASGERSFDLNTTDAASLPTLTRQFRDLVNLMPGVSPTGGSVNQGRLGGGGMDNVMMDGISIMDTGSNGLMGGLNIPVDQVSEVKVETSTYQAEFGRSSGLQISAVTKSGTNQFHGTTYYVKRNSNWNANSWSNIQNGLPKPLVNQTDWGYTVGGPIGKPGGHNSLFFFYGQEYQPRANAGATTNFRFPTPLERVGDFSQTRDQNGALFNAIYDSSTNLPKSQCVQGGATAACFQDGGVLGKIPMSRLYGPGLALLNQYPLPQFAQAPGTNFNYVSTAPTTNGMTYIPTVRVDYQVSPQMRVSGKFTGRGVRKITNYGSLPGYTDQFPLNSWVNTISGTVTYRLSPTTFLEGAYGTAQNALGNTNTSPYANRNSVNCPPNLSSVPNCTLGQIAFLLPNLPINPQYFADDALAGSIDIAPDGSFALPPRIAWSQTGTTSRVGNAPPSINFPGCVNYNRTQDVSVSVTRVMGRHTAKAGFYLNHSYKVQSPTISLSPNGNLNFGNDSNNPLDSQFPFANAALGIFSSYGQVAQYIEGRFVYNNVEWYLQDNWKMNSKLTLDYGLRFVHQTPQYDAFGQTTNFFPDQYVKADAPLLYVPGCANAAVTCTGTNRQAFNPRTGQSLGPGSASLIGAAIPGSGNFSEGITQAGQGIPITGFTYPALVLAPRVGGAYDVTGSQRIVVRGGFGIFYDRPDGHRAFTNVTNPPVVSSSTAQWGQLTQISNPQFPVGPVSNLFVTRFHDNVPSDAQWNLGVQVALPWSSSVDVAYVGHHAYNILNSGDNQAINLNTIDLGTTFLASSQDPTTAGSVLPDNLLRPFRGYGSIQQNSSQFYRTYHSLQTTFNRRFRNGVSFNVAWTLGLSDKGNQNPPSGDPVIRYTHNADGSYTIRADQATAEQLFADEGLIRHIVTSTVVWSLPTLQKTGTTYKVIGAVVNDWQLSAIQHLDSGAPYDASYSYQTGGGAALTGSSDYAARIINLSTPSGGCSSNQYTQFDTSIYSGPQVGSVGLDSARFTGLHACGNHIIDLAINRTIRLGGSRNLQIRADLANAFNMVIYNSVVTGVQWVSPSNLTVRNSQFLPDGSLDQTKAKPQSAGFGAANGAMAPRTVQLQARFSF
jgi:hypothetical protein